MRISCNYQKILSYLPFHHFDFISNTCSLGLIDISTIDPLSLLTSVFGRNSEQIHVSLKALLPLDATGFWSNQDCIVYFSTEIHPEQSPISRIGVFLFSCIPNISLLLQLCNSEAVATDNTLCESVFSVCSNKPSPCLLSQLSAMTTCKPSLISHMALESSQCDKRDTKGTLSSPVMTYSPVLLVLPFFRM